MREALDRAGLDGAFEEVLGKDDVSRPKPDPEIYLLTCGRLGADPTVSVALEDSPPGVAAARAAGMYVVGVPSEFGMKLDADARCYGGGNAGRLVGQAAVGMRWDMVTRKRSARSA